MSLTRRALLGGALALAALYRAPRLEVKEGYDQAERDRIWAAFDRMYREIRFDPPRRRWEIRSPDGDHAAWDDQEIQL